MQATHANGQERTADQAIPAYIPLGTGAHGEDHVYRNADTTVHVIDHNSTRTIYTVADTPLPDWRAWIDHVQTKRGWLELLTAAMIAAGLGGA